MIITINHVKNIFKTLPVGYYLGRNIVHVLDEHSNVSYYDFNTDEIHVSVENVLTALASVDVANETTLEEIVRGILYHEISHVLLSPKSLVEKVDRKYKDALNIVEDERIETLLRDMYMGVDFRKNIILLNNFRGEPPVTPHQYFYQVVRYHIGEKKHLAVLTGILNTYASLNANTESTDYKIYEYLRAIYEFYDSIVKDFNENPPKNNQNANGNGENDDTNENGNSTSNGESSENDDKKKGKSGSNQKSDKKDNDKNGNTKSGSGNKDEENDENGNSSNGNEDNTDNGNASDNNSKGKENGNKELTEEEVQEIVKKLSEIAKQFDKNVTAVSQKALSKILEEGVNKYYNPNYIEKMRQIVENKLKQNKRNGSAINAYSGVMDVRSVVREDYKWWVQQNRMGHVKRFSKVHFNLVLDNSSSFKNNDIEMNKILRALNEIVSNQFSFDVVTINSRMVVWENTKRLFKSSDGTNLTNEIGPYLKAHKKNDAYNYTIVLFDGDAHNDNHRIHPEPFRFFNDENTVVITNYENEQYLKACPRAKKQIINEDYTKHFAEVLFNLLDRALQDQIGFQ